MMGMGRSSNFGNSDTGRLSSFNIAEMYSVQSSRSPTPRPSNFKENSSPKFGYYPQPPASYPAPNPEIASAVPKTAKIQPEGGKANNSINNNNNHDEKELHMFVWSSSASPVSEVGGGGGGSGLHVFRGPDFGASEQSGRSDPGAKEIGLLVSDHPLNGEAKAGGDDFSFGGGGAGRDHGDDAEKDKEGTAGLSKVGPSGDLDPKMVGAGKHLPPTSVMTRLILIMVWRKLIRNLNTYSSLIGLILSLISFR
ncbi:auxin efflux carrier component 7 [Phtheirospermum japonicum]|uniref:Auxin efflux carrier component 7 n=1 Tax=Phtheirospermum japonicum TaxID=374723 RepID=A0A830BRH4_9LAMI|nr:auxin efflux carrier component 7 [Phtheirospermum japonicum]